MKSSSEFECVLHTSEHTDNAQVIFVLIEVCQTGGAVINFSKIAKNQNQTTLLLKKNFCYP